MGLLDFNLSDVGGVITGVREAITGEKIKDPVEMAKVELQLQALENALKTGQLEVNKAEAQHGSVFVAGWRPFIGWVGGCGFSYQFILHPILLWAWSAWGVVGVAAPPPVDTGTLLTLLLGMLGIGAQRSFDKLKKTDTKGMK